MLLRREAHQIVVQHLPSAALAAAQVQLKGLRQQRRRQRIEQSLPVYTDREGRLTSLSHNDNCAKEPLPPDRRGEWESKPFTAALESARRRRRASRAQTQAFSLAWLPPAQAPAASPSPPRESRSPTTDTLRLFPDLALALLKQDKAAAGRIWLLLRYLDRDGRGWISTADARAQLTRKGAPLRICGWRQLRNLLAQGEGIFWQRANARGDNERIWLRSITRVAAALGLSHLQYQPVSLPIAILCEGIGTVRAHFYASYHSARGQANPISRQTLKVMSGLSPRTQQIYERRANVKRAYNWAIGPRYRKETAQERAWQHGRAIFRFTDHRGNHGRPGASYLAWQLPNNYSGPHAPHPPGCRKRINQKLADLFMKGMTGNGKQEVAERCAPPGSAQATAKCFYQSGQTAARHYNRSPQTDAYWVGPSKDTDRSFWHLLPAQQAR